MYSNRFLTASFLLILATACSSNDLTQPGLDAFHPTGAITVSLTSASPPSVAYSITLSPAKATLAVGSTLQLSGIIQSVTGSDLTTTYKSQVTFVSNDTTIAKVSSTGLITGKRAGVVAITGRLGTLSGVSMITVGAGTSGSTVYSITLSPAKATLAVGSTLQLNEIIQSATGLDLTTTYKSQVTFVSNDTTIAKVTSTGLITGKRAGVVAITGRLGTLSGVSMITVGTGTPASVASSITLSPATVTLAVGSTIQLSEVIKSATDLDLTTTYKSQVTFVSNDTTIAKVSSTGLVTGKRAGVATITAKLGTLSGVSKITVSTPPGAVSSPISSLALLSDDFKSYSSTTSFLANVSSNIGGTGNYLTSLYNDGVSAKLAQIDPTVSTTDTRRSSTRSLVGCRPARRSGSTSPNGKVLTKMWFRAKIRFSPGFSTTGVLVPPAPNSANAYKLLGWGWNTYDGSGRLEITNTNQYDFYWTPISNGSA